MNTLLIRPLPSVSGRTSLLYIYIPHIDFRQSSGDSIDQGGRLLRFLQFFYFFFIFLFFFFWIVFRNHRIQPILLFSMHVQKYKLVHQFPACDCDGELLPSYCPGRSRNHRARPYISVHKNSYFKTARTTRSTFSPALFLLYNINQQYRCTPINYSSG